MSMTRQTILASRPAALVLAMSLVAGLSAPFIMLPTVHAAATIPDGTTELSATPVNQTTAVPPNLAVTFDDSGSMNWTRLGDAPPWTTKPGGGLYFSSMDWGSNGNQGGGTTGGPWRCANVIDANDLVPSQAIRNMPMNGVYYNPNVTYTPPDYANGTPFPNADKTLTNVWVDGIAVNRPLNPATPDTTAGYNNNPDLDYPSAGSLTNLMGTFSATVTYYASFGTTSTCPATAVAGSCVQHNSGTSRGSYVFYVANVDGTNGWGRTAVYYGQNLQTSSTAASGYTAVVGNSNSNTKYYVTWQQYNNDHRWQCGTGSGSNIGQSAFWNGASPMDGKSHTLSDGTTVTYPNGGPYYYRLKKTVTIAVDQYGNPTNTGCNTTDCDGLHTLYDPNSWEAIPVPQSQYQNFANWYAYYRTRNQMARSSLSRVFSSPSLAHTTASGGFGNDIRVAWQNLYTYDKFTLQSSAIISALIDQNPANCDAGGTGSATPPALGSQSLISGTVRTPPSCYRSDFFNWIFQIPATSGTPTRSAIYRAGQFFTRGSGNTGVTGDLHDPYWQPPQTGTYSSTNTGNELYCRQNYTLLITDGLWNGDQDGPLYSSLTLPTAGTALPDGVVPPDPTTAGVTSIYNPVNDSGAQDGYSGYASLSDIAYNFWATDLRQDLYLGGTGSPDPTHIVPPYLPDTYTGLFSAGNVNGGNGAAKDIPAEEYFNPKNDPATWPHMSFYMIGLGVSGQLNFSDNTDCKDASGGSTQDACDLRKGITNSLGITGWPAPDGSGSGIAANIDDSWHAGLDGRGQFFSAGNPQQLVDQLTSVLSSISARASAPTPASVNASVATVGALSFETSYKADWSGTFAAVTLNSDGSAGSTLWSADIPAASSRNIYTDSYKGGTFSSFAFTTANVGSLDASENTAAIPASGSTAATPGLGLQSPAFAGTNDTVANRIDYLRGDQTHETDGTYRKRTSLLGAIINSQPVYVAYPSGNYYNNWPSGSPEAVAAAASNGHDDKSYDSFVADHATRPGTVYVGANDGMLHAFNAPVPQCTSYDPATGICSHYDSGTNPGLEDWAFIPRAVYANLGNLTSVSNFQYRPTVDATPVTRDVFFDGDNTWHTILAGGVGLGGRGVYALDITQAPTTQPTVLWEFDSDIPIPSSDNCQSIQGSQADSIGCRATDLGFTVSQPNIGRLANGKWVVIVPNGYFPDCSKPDIPTADKTSCQAIAAQAPKDSAGNPYSALFVLDAETGKPIAELKTPTDIPGVTSFGLATPVMGDYQNDQIDDVAFAGDLQGNLWRFDLSSSSPSGWSVTLVYKGIADSNGNQGLQPITTMPRLFPDPSTNRFMVVFGTGKYLGAGDNGNNAVQALYGVRDPGACTTDGGCAVTQSSLVQQYLHETVVPSTLPDGSTPPNAGATLRCVTGAANDNCTTTTTAINPVPASAGGWRIDLATYSSGAQTDSGERVVVSPGAIFASNTVVFETLIAGASGSDPCNPATQGAIMALNSNTGGPSGVSSLGGWPIAGGRINNARTGGSLPIVSALGGGQAYLPGTALAPNGKTPLSIDAPIWRRRSWSEIKQN